jgi:hypothetical protein
VIFVLSYDRAAQRRLNELEFSDERGVEAELARVELEGQHAGDDNVEVILLRSETAETLRRTHSRYFESPREIMAKLGQHIATAS